MNIFFSGGGSPWIPEIQLTYPSVMLSYWVNVNQKTGKPDSRFKKLTKIRKKGKKNDSDKS